MRSKQPAIISASVEVVVPFHDVDIMNVVWHGHYVKYLEIARTALIKEFDYDHPQMAESGYAWPVTDLHLRYAKPAKYGKTLVVTAELIEWELRMKIRYTIVDKDSGERLSRAETTQVALAITTGEMCFGSPALVREKLLKAGGILPHG